VESSNPDSVSGRETELESDIRSCKNTELNELDVREPSVVSISQGSEELRLYNLI
jgi:hypothetical protein